MAVKPTIHVAVYFSAPIRGEKGSNASQKEMDENIKSAKKMALRVKEYFGTLLDMYVPHDQDELIQILWHSKKISVWDILEGDCKIVAQRSILLVWARDGFFSTGMGREMKTAEENGVPIIQFDEFNDEVVCKILTEINKVVFKDKP